VFCVIFHPFWNILKSCCIMVCASKPPNHPGLCRSTTWFKLVQAFLNTTWRGATVPPVWGIGGIGGKTWE
jgi:hypothetical protein